MLSVSLTLIAGIAIFAAPELENAMSVQVTGPWSVQVGPGTVDLGDRQVTLSEPVLVDIAPPESVAVRDEEHSEVPMFNDKAGGWVKGARLKSLITIECTATGLLDPASVRIKPKPGDSAPFTFGRDYKLDEFWGTFGTVEGSAMAQGRPVFVDYDYSPCRLDSVVVDASGNAKLLAGVPKVGALLPPTPAPGETAIVNIWVPGRTERVTDENLYPIEFFERPEASGPCVAERLLPNTLAKLRAGEGVTIVAWGDSVTNGGGVEDHPGMRYQDRFEALLKERFPESEITMKTAAWGGANSSMYMAEPAGSTYDFVRDVLDPRPDMVTIEFVNDSYLEGEALAAHYTEIMNRLRGVGAEIVLITPHFVRPDWMGVTTQKVDADPRPYVRDLREFARANDIALADASTGWTRLWRQGIPYMTLEANSINHPDARGHEIFARALMDLFPEDD